MVPSGSRRVGATHPALASCSPAVCSAARAPGRSFTSAFAGATQALVVCLATRFTARPNPRFDSGTTKRTQGKVSRTRSGDPSVEPLSTTQTAARPCRRRRPARRGIPAGAHGYSTKPRPPSRLVGESRERGDCAAPPIGEAFGQAPGACRCFSPVEHEVRAFVMHTVVAQTSTANVCEQALNG